jgi:hypothetical protein
MEICNESHPEIVYTSFCCPLCESLEKYDELSSELEETQYNYETTLDTYAELRQKVNKVNPELLL